MHLKPRTSKGSSTAISSREIVALDEFHHEGGHAPAFFEAVDGGNVRMIQGGQRLRFTLKASQPIGVMGDCVGEDLDRDVAVQRRVPRPKHLAHPAFAYLRRDCVDAEASAGNKGQR